MMRKFALFLVLTLVVILISRPLWLPILVIPNLLPNNRIRPLEWITPKPTIQSENIIHEEGFLSADFYLPKGGEGPKEVLLLIHGVNELGKDDPRLRNFGQTLARAQVPSLVPTFPNLLRSRFTPEAADEIASSLAWIKNNYPGAEVSVISFSVAGGPMFITADGNQEKLKLLLSFGSHFDLKHVLKYLTTKTYKFGNEIFVSEPDQFAKDLLLKQYSEIFGPDPNIEAIFGNTDPAKFDQLYENLRPEVKKFMQELSPAGHLNNINAEKILILHSDPDLVVPHTESLRLKQALGDKAKLTLLQIFSHVNIGFPKFRLETFFNFYLPESAKLYKIVFQILK